jgi:hypothetical protein
MKFLFMKMIFYRSLSATKKFMLLFFAAIVICGITTKAQTFTITFPNAPPPTNDPSVDRNDANGQGIETGVRFYVTQPGTITKIRFYKGNLVTGTHIGHLWSNTGTKLAEATFTETANNWQEVTVSVHVTAGINYVASVFDNIGDYALEPPGTTWQDQTGGIDYGTDPIKVVAWGNDPGHNGIYNYSNSVNGTFPNSNNLSPNYWIDVRFQPDFPLPVTLSDLKATPANSDILVSWKTSSETNNKGFEIQRSNNGTDWYAVNFINGAGESTIIKNYNYTDKALAPGLYYYRLRQEDFDGKSKLSPVVTATISGKGTVSLFANYPNPFSTTSTLRFDLPRDQKIRLSIFDLAGREVKVLADQTGEAGSHLVTLDAAGLRRQTYLVRLQTENGVLSQKILVQ